MEQFKSDLEKTLSNIPSFENIKAIAIYSFNRPISLMEHNNLIMNFIPLYSESDNMKNYKAIQSRLSYTRIAYVGDKYFSFYPTDFFKISILYRKSIKLNQHIFGYPFCYQVDGSHIQYYWRFQNFMPDHNRKWPDSLLKNPVINPKIDL